MKKVIFLIPVILLIVLGGFFGLKEIRIQKGKPPAISKSSKTTEEISLSVLSVYFTESEDPKNVYLNMRVKWWPAEGIGAPSCDIYFPSQEGMEMGTGPIENGCNFVAPIGKEEEKPVKEAILKETIARSYYQDHFAPEFGKEYFVKIKFYWPSLQKFFGWEGKVGWHKISAGERAPMATRGTTGTGEAAVSFPSQPSPSNLEQAIYNVWVPSFECNVI